MRDFGFTLLELLTAMAIVSILVAIAAPQYQEYKKRGYDVRASSDLRNAAFAQEVYYIDTEEYLSCSNEECTELPGIATLSKGVSLKLSATPTGFLGTSTHSKGTGKVFTWDSSAGGIQE